ncbi:uracil-DNA glycosylase family protein [Bacillus sp. REN10]|uniref:uracil-DNA glycosylase family protein n=1 Tax=Bacillus sp. REN10 TaxID=2782541 RepID=UPI00193C55FA|nr:uracil-DNA glycosylase family protein [Bacillus sp. REN10]
MKTALKEKAITIPSKERLGNFAMYHYEKGRQDDIAFVFSCPGAVEEMEGRPAAGRTGKNLERLLSILNKEYRKDISWTRNDITITNAWSHVEYKARSGRTEATVREVLSAENLRRLCEEIKHVKTAIICSGERAAASIFRLVNEEKLNPSVQVAKIRHLGLRSLNQIKKDIHGEPIILIDEAKKTGYSPKVLKQMGRENTEKRLQVVA